LAVQSYFRNWLTDIALPLRWLLDGRTSCE
jgi:hypothetical protein